MGRPGGRPASQTVASMSITSGVGPRLGAACSAAFLWGTGSLVVNLLIGGIWGLGRGMSHGSAA